MQPALVPYIFIKLLLFHQSPRGLVPFRDPTALHGDCSTR
jgi:hypothetical protein